MGQLGEMTRAIHTQGIAQMIQPFDGQPFRFRTWMKAIDKYAALVGANDALKVIIAYQLSSGVVSDFVKRFLEEADIGTWQELKRQLTLRFAEVTDEQHAFALLQRVRQERDESVPLFPEWLQTLANEAFPEGQGGPVQRQLVGFFIDGLAHDYLKMKLMCENPMEFERAVGIATEE